ncbi:MAG: transcriptional regulator [Anaerolineales bacterium]
MADVFEELTWLGCLIHEPARLSIMTALNAVDSVNFLFLQRLTGLTAGNLSSQLAKLEEAGLLQVEKSFVDKCPKTTEAITQEGRDTVESYWEGMERLGGGVYQGDRVVGFQPPRDDSKEEKVSLEMNLPTTHYTHFMLECGQGF